jgi:hypothetical protein
LIGEPSGEEAVRILRSESRRGTLLVGLAAANDMIETRPVKTVKEK